MNDEKICANCVHCDDELAGPYYCLIRHLETHGYGSCENFGYYPQILVR